MSKPTYDCPEELNEKIKTEILAKADYENSEAGTGVFMFFIGLATLVIATLTLGIIGMYGKSFPSGEVIAVLYSFPLIYIGIGAYSIHREKHHRDHKFHAIADKIREERRKQHSKCSQKIMAHYDSPVTN